MILAFTCLTWPAPIFAQGRYRLQYKRPKPSVMVFTRHHHDWYLIPQATVVFTHHTGMYWYLYAPDTQWCLRILVFTHHSYLWYLRMHHTGVYAPYCTMLKLIFTHHTGWYLAIANCFSQHCICMLCMLYILAIYHS